MDRKQTPPPFHDFLCHSETEQYIELIQPHGQRIVARFTAGTEESGWCYVEDGEDGDTDCPVLSPSKQGVIRRPDILVRIEE